MKQFPSKRWYLLTSLSPLNDSNGPLLIPHIVNTFLQQAHSEKGDSP